MVGLMQNNYQGTTMNKTTQDYKGNFYDDVTKKTIQVVEVQTDIKSKKRGG